jgi:ABC-type histidine transport system ATPase subunit
MVRQGIKALNDSLPAMMQGLQQARQSLERALANMPDPTYPTR